MKCVTKVFLVYINILNMEFLVNKDYLLSNLSFEIYSLLTVSLEKNNALQKIEQNCPELYEKIQPSYRQPCRTLIEQLLANLIEMGCTIELLVIILKNSHLYDTASIFVTEQMSVTKQLVENTNEERKIQRGTEFNLEFRVFGIPQPVYRWYRNNVLLEEKTESNLVFEQYTPELSGDYVCEAVQTFPNETKVLKSNVIKIETKEESCVIVKRPPQNLTVRSSAVPQVVELQVIANGYPKPRFEWMHDNKVLPVTTPLLMIKNEKKFEGVYRCRVSNSVSNDIFIVTHYKVIETNHIFIVNSNKVSEKVALLIGNENYANNDRLTTPLNDKNALAEKLEKRGFLVLNPSNLTLNGIKCALQIFLEMCVPDSIVFFYFTGHGFELSDKYLMPIDAPDIKKMRRTDSVSESEVLQKILSKKPKFIVSILDMCLKFPNRVENNRIYEEEVKIFNEYKSDRNLIQAYSTTTGSSAFEIGERENSLYNMMLLREIDKNLPVLQILFNVNKEFKRLADRYQTNENINKINEQMPSLFFNVAEDFQLDVPKQGHPNSMKTMNIFNKLQCNPNY